jgi:hypothetical protein
MWVAGSGSLAVGPPPAGMWGHPGLLSGWLCRAWLVLYLFMPWGCGDDMTWGKFVRVFCGGTLFRVVRGSRLGPGCPAKAACTLYTLCAPEAPRPGMSAPFCKFRSHQFMRGHGPCDMTFRLVLTSLFLRDMAGPPVRLLGRTARLGLCQDRRWHVGIRDRGPSSVAVLAVDDQSCLSHNREGGIRHDCQSVHATVLME